MVSRTHERQEFIVAIVGMAAKVKGRLVSKTHAIDLARAAMRHATSEQKWCEVECSVNVDDAERAKQEKKSERRLGRMLSIAVELGVELQASGDPRGAVYRLGGVAVPADGYTADQIERMSKYWERVRELREMREGKEASKS